MSATPSKGNYQWYNADQVFDYLVTLEMKPVVELSFMPSHFVKGCARGGDGTTSCQHAFSDSGGYKGLTMPPDDFGDWYRLVEDLTSHLVERWG
jgi:xylan 1,4-beta-xylosidase